MTREQKLALVLGFAAVLVVGLLISDHLAAARSADLEDAPHDATVVVDASEGQALRRVVTLPPAQAEYRGRPARQIETTDRALASAPEPREVVAPTPEPVAERPQPEPIQLVLGGDGGLYVPGEPARSRSVLDVVGDSVAEGAEAVAEGVRKLTGLAQISKPNGMAAMGQDGARAVSREVSTEPMVVQHHVQPNESLYKIAARYYGDGNTWRRIAEDNAGRVGENGSVREGVTLRILDPIKGVGSEQPTTSARAERSSTPAPPSNPLTYTVKSGDTLGEIAQELLGTVRRQHELIALNRDVLKDPDNLRAGMVLKLPSS
ncbi:MAG: LysM peptidoglycan-binding domain-containing protein [Phycisphaerales bacterium]